jgi:hypothetical protein
MLVVVLPFALWSLSGRALEMDCRVDGFVSAASATCTVSLAIVWLARATERPRNVGSVMRAQSWLARSVVVLVSTLVVFLVLAIAQTRSVKK